MMYRKVCFRVNDCTRIEGLFQHRAAGKKKPERHNLRAARAVRDKPERRNLRAASCAPRAVRDKPERRNLRAARAVRDKPERHNLCAASCALRNLLLTDGE
jgi:hypothetical protein